MMVSTVIIFSGALGRENSNILVIVIYYLILPAFSEDSSPLVFGNMMQRHVIFFFSFWYTLVAGVNAAKIKPQEILTLSLKKSSESEKIFPTQVCRRELFLLFFHGEPGESEAVLLLWAHAVSFDAYQQGILSYC